MTDKIRQRYLSASTIPVARTQNIIGDRRQVTAQCYPAPTITLEVYNMAASRADYTFFLLFDLSRCCIYVS